MLQPEADSGCSEGVIQSNAKPIDGRTARRPELRVQGKFLFAGERKLYLRGVTYGPLRPGDDGCEYGTAARVESDFAQMAAHGINALRTYTVPPRWLLDCAERHALRVLVGLSWEQHVAFLEDRAMSLVIERSVRDGVRASADHPALLAYALGNEIPSSIVRWHGRRRVERFIERLYQAAKKEAPACLLTYVNYPSTEYLQLPFLDFVCFNVYLEVKPRLEAYLARLQNIASDRPLVIGEIGLDSRRHGPEAQARSLEWQVRGAFAAGCAGAFAYAWTDEWHRGGDEVLDWDFGLTDRARRPKPALAAVHAAFGEVPFPPTLRWPKISVIVCSYNGERTIGECLRELRKLAYPNYEVIVVDDGSTDRTAAIARAYDLCLISTPNRGLSSARNTGLAAAKGEIVAYIDDDAYPDPQWLTYLAAFFMSSDHAGIGGPNLPPPDDGPIAECVANAPGGPIHVLLSDRQAEHIPGCNMAFRKRALESIGGFDPIFRAAGDDVDVCWRLQRQGMTLGFSPAAVVWHHRRNSVRAYFRQQKGYGKAEALLERKWPEKYNELGHLRWAGRAYGRGLPQLLTWQRARIYQGTWGSAPFQSIYEPSPGTLLSLTLMPEWYLLVALLGLYSLLGLLWRPMLLSLPFFAVAAGLSLGQALLSTARVSFRGAASTPERLRLHALTALLHLLQPMARLYGRLSNGLTPWRRGQRKLSPRIASTRVIWSERWSSAHERLKVMEAELRGFGAYVHRGGPFDGWDLEVRGGLFGAARVKLAIEEHGRGKQLLRLRLWARQPFTSFTLTLLLASTAASAALDGAWLVSAILTSVACLFALRALQEHSAVMLAFDKAVHSILEQEQALLVSSRQRGRMSPCTHRAELETRAPWPDTGP